MRGPQPQHPRPPTRPPTPSCSNGFFGRPGENCLPCPTGAVCYGYVSEVVPTFPSLADGYVVAAAGLHYYPIPLPGFFDLNDTLKGICPAGSGVPGRDSCVVGCSPPEACAGGNLCAAGYASKAPTFRCGSCDKGFYASGGRCIKCSSSPVMLVVGIALIVIAAGGAGYFLSRKGINLAFLSIGVDFFQVLAMFSNAQIAWPPALAQMWTILSAFSEWGPLRRELRVPPSLQRWHGLLLLPPPRPPPPRQTSTLISWRLVRQRGGPWAASD